MAFDPVTFGAAVNMAKDPATIKASVEDWLDNHPEATTTVEDGSITKAKLHDDLADEIDDNTADVAELKSDVGDLEDDVGGLKSAIEDLEAGSLSALGATSGQVPTADGEGSWDWQNQPVTDVQVNGTSILSNGVANVPVAGASTLGVVKPSVDYGTSISGTSGTLRIYPATAVNIKSGEQEYRAIVPAYQHRSTFYGLAKAAGADMASSNNPVGTYTDEAKSAIQTMLGISGIIAPVEDATASKPYAIGDAFLHGGALYKASAAIAAGDAIVPGTNCTQTTIIEMLKGA